MLGKFKIISRTVCFDSQGLLKPDQIWVSAPNDGTLEVWKTWKTHVIVNDNSMTYVLQFTLFLNLLLNNFE